MIEDDRKTKAECEEIEEEKAESEELNEKELEAEEINVEEKAGFEAEEVNAEKEDIAAETLSDNTVEDSFVLDKDDQKGAVEALLFTMGDSQDLDTMSAALAMEKDELKELLSEMIDEYDDPANKRGIHIIKLEDRYQLATKKAYYPVLIRMVKEKKKVSLSDVVMETLSIIAYKQPITRIEIEKIRGVKCDHAVNRLLEYNLIHEVGRLDAPGRPILFGTTEEFLRHFGTDSIEDLPAINPVKIEDFRAEAEEEAQVRLGI